MKQFYGLNMVQQIGILYFTCGYSQIEIHFKMDFSKINSF